nr:DUF11 domain-containing protein [Clavibacter sp. VKM Ac-2873]
MAEGSSSGADKYNGTLVCTDTRTGSAVQTGGSYPTWTLAVSTHDPYSCEITNASKQYETTKTVDKQTAGIGDIVTYTVTVANSGRYAYTTEDPASFTDDFSDVADDATYNDDITGGASVDGTTASWRGALAVGETKSFTYSFTVTAEGSGNDRMVNLIPDVPPVVTLIQRYELSKTADKSSLSPGEKVTYTVTAKNTGQVPYTDSDPASFSDDLSQVTDDATYNNDASNGLAINGDDARWSGALAVGETRTFRYSFTVNDPVTGDMVLTNGVVGPPRVPVTPPTQVPVKLLERSKSADKTMVAPGDTITYTVTVKNTGKYDYTEGDPAAMSDDFSDVADDATYNGDITGGAAVSGTTASWKGALGAGQTKTFTYSFTVKPAGSGDGVLTNALEGFPPVSTPVTAYAVAKSVDKSSAAAGDRVSYTITVTNTGQAAYTDEKPASFTDDLSEVLDDATYNGDASNGATVSGQTLSWKGALGVGETKTVTYSFTVNDPDTGDKQLKNAVVPADPSGSCSTAGGCATTTNIVPDPPRFPTVSTGGMTLGSAQVWPMLGLAGGSVLVLLALLVLLMAGRRRDGDSV